MTRSQYEREKLRLAREKQLQILADAERNADPRYAREAAQFWLERWRGSRSSQLGRSRSLPTARSAARFLFVHMKHLRPIELFLSSELYLELVDAAAETYQGDERGCTPEEFARECIEAALATRRLERVAV